MAAKHKALSKRYGMRRWPSICRGTNLLCPFVAQATEFCQREIPSQVSLATRATWLHILYFQNRTGSTIGSFCLAGNAEAKLKLGRYFLVFVPVLPFRSARTFWLLAGHRSVRIRDKACTMHPLAKRNRT